MKRTVFFGVLSTLVLLAGCHGGGFAGSAQGSPYAVPGVFADLAVSDYPAYGSLQVPGGPLDAQQDTDTLLRQKGWSDTKFASDSAVDTNAIVSGVIPYADAFFFFGHGDVGDLLFHNAGVQGASTQSQYWGVGSQIGKWADNSAGLPISGRLKWMFLESSDTVAQPSPAPGVTPPPGIPEETDPHWMAPLAKYFGTKSSGFLGSLHGMYGYWQAPGGSCANRVCDVDAHTNDNTIVAFLRFALPAQSGAQPQIIHDAWMQSNMDAGNKLGWSEFEDQGTMHDTLSGPPATATGTVYGVPQGHYTFTFPVPTMSKTGTAVAVQPTTFTLQPMTLAKESIDDATQIGRAQQYLNQTIATVNNGSTNDATSSGGVRGTHFYGDSGAVVVHGVGYQNPVGFTDATASQNAQDYVVNTLGMPGDAVLDTELGIYQMDADTSSIVQTGYEYVWRHSSGQIMGGDEIVVLVQDHQTTTKQCLEMTQPDPPFQPQCISWQITTNDNPNISYSKRLWRSPDSTRVLSLQSAGRQTGGQSIDAYTASLSLDPGAIVISYIQGYWTPSAIATGSPTAQPAWLFTLQGGEIVAVDAFSGAILGTIPN